MFNYSSVVLTESMEKVLNRGLNFCILPLNLDITQVLVDFHRFERSMIWYEFWYGKNQNEHSKTPMFKSRKDNLPRNYPVPQGLKTFLGAVKSELMDPHNRQKVTPNLLPEELGALKELISLQKNRQIVIKKCDKGAGIIILDFHTYMEACMKHLSMEQTSENGNLIPYYLPVDDTVVIEAQNRLLLLIQEGYDNNLLTKEEFQNINPSDKKPGRFYLLFKIHKEHEIMTAPPERPIISGSGSYQENASIFVDYHLKELSTKHPSYLQDTPHFLRLIDELNKGPKLPQNAIIVTFDVVGLYTNIPQEEGLKTAREALEERVNPETPSDFIVRMLEIILKFNIFEFDKKLYRQVIGTSMGSRVAPSYANLFMARSIDANIIKIFNEYGGVGSVKILKRFLDDIFNIFVGSTKILHKIFEAINRLHPTIKLTMNHTSILHEKTEDKCPCPPQYSLSYLDTSCSIEDGIIITDLFRKPTDCNNYLLTSSCHPTECTDNIPYSLALRINRICTKPADREKRFSELKNLLLERQYRPGMIDSAINRARAVSRADALKQVDKSLSEQRPVFVVLYDPRLPSIPIIQKKHWRSMKNQDPYLAEVFTRHPLTAYKRQKNIGDLVINAKIPQIPKTRPIRLLNGMKRCGKNCPVCPFVREGRAVDGPNFTWKINRNLNCLTSNCVYMIFCNVDTCRQRYIGETDREIKERISEHKGYIYNDKFTQAVGEHFNLPGHDLSKMTFTVLEKVKKLDTQYRKQREKYFIKKFNTFYRGINKKS